MPRILVNRSKLTVVAVSLLTLCLGACNYTRLSQGDLELSNLALGGRSSLVRVVSSEVTVTNVPTELDDTLSFRWGEVTLEKKTGPGKKADFWKYAVGATTGFIGGLII